MTTVQILGIEGSPDTQKMRANVDLALTALGVKATVENITKVDDLIKFKINGIPALVVNGTVVLQKNVPESDDLQAMLKVFIGLHPTHFSMKKLIVPTDFSPTSENAFRYALHLAALRQGSIKTVNVFSPEFDPQNPYLADPMTVMEETARGQLQEFVVKTTKSMNGKSIPSIEKETIIGFPAEEIIRMSCEDKADLIVMGATGEKGLFEKLFGSISVAVAQKADCPVLLVPEGAEYRAIKQILYASDFENLSEESLEHLLEITGYFKAGVHFVHVESSQDKKDFKAIENSLFKFLFKNGEPPFSFTISKVTSHSVADGLFDYAAANDIDMVVLIHPRRNFWESIFRKSVTKEIAFKPQLPVMVLHDH